MKKIILIALILLSSSSHAWTLGSSQGFKFTSSDVTFKIASNTCTYAGFTSSSIETLANDAINQYWAKVPTSALKLSSGGVQSGIDTSSDDLTTAALKGAANNIVVGCSSNATLFSDPTTLAVGGIACNSGVCQAAVLLNDTAATQLDTLDRQTIITTFAHELGHGLGLGHASSKTSLMYYSVSGKTQKTLSQDDIDGISYLYPSEKKLGGIAGACGTIDTSSKGPGNFLGSFVLGLALLILFKFKNKARLFT